MRSFHASKAGSSRHAFTLVELLVVIGIIALLISILLPSLGRAREAANSVKCSANLHSLGQALQIYLQDSKGMLPIGYWDGTKDPTTGTTLSTSNVGGADARKTNWGLLLMSRLNPKLSTNVYDIGQQTSLNATSNYRTLQCPTAPTNTGSMTNATGGINRIVNDYASHPRLMPQIGDGSTDGATNRAPTTVRTARIRRSSEIATLFDGSLVVQADGNFDAAYGGVPVADRLDGWRYRYSSNVGTTFMTDNYPIAPGMKNTDAVDTRTASNDSALTRNTDSADNIQNIRFRHYGGTIANVLFLDGHVEGVRISKDKSMCDLKRSNINTSF